jgi:septation ring formation regulator EzrA
VEFWDKLGRVLQRLVNNAEYRKLIGVTNAEALDRIMIKIGSRMGKYKESDDLGDRVEANIVKKEVTLYLVVLRRRIIFIPSINNFINIYQ